MKDQMKPLHGQHPAGSETARQYRRAQLEQLVRWWPLLAVLLCVPLLARWLWPTRPWLAVLPLGVCVMSCGVLRWHRAAPDDRVPPSAVQARAHYLAVAVGGALLTAVGALLAFLL